MADRTYTFEDFQIDPARSLLTRLPDGRAVTLTHKAFQVLLLLVENRGELVSKSDLMTHVWRDSFVEEANLTQTISVLRKALGENPAEHRFIVTESGKGYRFVAPVVELNSDVPSDRAANSRTEEFVTMSARHTSRRNYLFAGLAIVALVSVVAFYYAFNRTGVQPPKPSSTLDVKAIAVLPFRSAESDDENRMLGIGMADAVIARLSHIKSIAVRQTSSVIRYADSTPEATKIGREINVDAILEGSIQKADGRIRVSVRLFRVGDGSLAWAETFDEKEADIFALQDAISQRVASSLALQLNGEERDRLNRRFTDNVEAYHLYNKGRFFWNRRSRDDLRKSIEFYEQAIAKDDNYALAYAGIAESYVLLHTFSQAYEKDLFPKAKQAAEKALSLDQNLAEAHAALALYNEQYEWNWEESELEFKKAISANENYATAHQWYGEFLAFRGRTSESIAETERAVDLDPLSLSTNTARAFPYMAERRYGEALERLKPALELDKDFPQALYYLGRSYEGIGRYEEAIATYEKAIAVSGRSSFFVSAMIYSLVKNGQRQKAERTLDEVLEIERTEPISRYVLARSLAALGKKEKALDALDEAFQNRDSLLAVVRIDPNFDEMRDEPKFQELLKKIGF